LKHKKQIKKGKIIRKAKAFLVNYIMKIMPVMTEKSMRLTKDRGFTFLVPVEVTKTQIKKLIEQIYSVNVINIRTLRSKPLTKKNTRGKEQKIKATKKAIVFLKEGEKISLFEEEKKKAKKIKAKPEVKKEEAK
jgi:large subunit ribosomal protein L23